MESIWLGTAPGSATTRVLAMGRPHETLSKPRLTPDAAHPRARARLLEAMAQWQKLPSRIALRVEGRAPTFDSTFCRDVLVAHGSPLVGLFGGPTDGLHRRSQFPLGGLDDFRELERLFVGEVAR